MAVKFVILLVHVYRRASYSSAAILWFALSCFHHTHLSTPKVNSLHPCRSHFPSAIATIHGVRRFIDCTYLQIFREGEDGELFAIFYTPVFG